LEVKRSLYYKKGLKNACMLPFRNMSNWPNLRGKSHKFLYFSAPC
jgi:hypothetical protein